MASENGASPGKRLRSNRRVGGGERSPGRVGENDGALLPKERRVLERRIEEVTKANQKFYEAFESLDISKMDEVWAHLDYVTCVHPGWTLRSEWPAVRDSWVLIFNNTFSMKFELTESMVQVAGDMAWVICVENITSQQSDEPQQVRVLATNLFERIGDEWLMIHHHGSPIIKSED